MGITNLLPLLEKSTKSCHVSVFRGSTVAVDSYCWLHKGARSCAEQLVKGEPTDIYVFYCLKYVKMLLSYDIKPIMVFDGRHLPAKLKTEEKRKENKKIAKKQAIDLLRLGKVEEARKYFQQCIDITPEMALALIKECRKLNIDCIVAPYESDAQLAFFSIRGIAECIITEDSDLLLFGCKKVLYKMDLSGNGQLVEADKIYLSLKMKPENYTFDKFRYMCILSGCDYVDSLRGVGPKKALKFIAMTAETKPENFLDKVPRYLNMRHLVVDDEYKENFLIADATFRYQTVFDPINKKLVPLNEFDESTKHEYCRNAGAFFDNDEAFQLAMGNLNPLTMEKIDNWKLSELNQNNFINSSIWSKHFKPRVSRIVEKKKTAVVVIHSTNTKNEIEENLNAQYDLKIERELKFYNTPIISCKKKEVSSESEEEEEEEDEEEEIANATSPVLGNISRNPFIKQKISKFSLTNTDSNCIVKSRFFHTKSEDSGVAVDLESTENLTAEEIQTEIDIEQTSALLKVNCDIKGDITNTQPMQHFSPSLVSRKNAFPTNLNKKRKAKPISSSKLKPVKKQVTIQQLFKNMAKK